MSGESVNVYGTYKVLQCYSVDVSNTPVGQSKTCTTGGRSVRVLRITCVWVRVRALQPPDTADDVEKVDGRPGKGHSEASKTTAWLLCLGLQFLKFLLVLHAHTHAHNKTQKKKQDNQTGCLLKSTNSLNQHPELTVSEESLQVYWTLVISKKTANIAAV